MAIKASKGPVEVAWVSEVSCVRSLVELPNRSPALLEPVADDCTWEPEKSLEHFMVSHVTDESAKRGGKAMESIAILGLLLHGNGKLPRARNTLDHDIGLLHAALLKLCLDTSKERIDDPIIPTSPYDTNPESTSIMKLRRGPFVMHAGELDTEDLCRNWRRNLRKAWVTRCDLE